MTDIPLMQRMTTRYVMDEDRIALTGTLEGGSCQLWLTYRLLRRLLPSLVAWLDEQELRVAHAQVLQRWAQEYAVSCLEPSPAVPAPSGAHDCIWRPLSVTLKKDSSAMLLIWRVDEGLPVVGLRLEAYQMRQWLHILQRQCDVAVWIDLQWPAWLSVMPASRTVQ